MQFIQPIPFFSKIQRARTVNPDLIITGGGFYNHPSGFKKIGAGLMMSDEQVNIQIVCEKIVRLDDRIGFEKDVSAAGIFSFKIGDVFRGRCDRPSAGCFIKDRQAEAVFKVIAYFP